MTSAGERTHARSLVRPYALIWFYRRWLRAHGPQEALAGVGIAIAVALVFATMVAAGSITGSAREVVDAVIGPATLQLHARTPAGMPESLLARVESLPGVRQAAPLLEQTATVQADAGRQVTVDLAGAQSSLVVLDGLAHTLPRATLIAGGIGLSVASAEALHLIGEGGRSGADGGGGRSGGLGGRGGGVGGAGGPRYVTLKLRGRSRRLRISAMLGRETFGALAQATVAVMPLRDLQRLAGLRGRVSRILVVPASGRRAAVRRELQAAGGAGVEVAPASQDVGLLAQALRPSDQASAFFAAVSALLGLLLAAGAMLLTAPERRRMIAELRLMGSRPSAIAQMFMFQGLVLGVVASGVGLAAGYGLSRALLPSSPQYLKEAFTLGTGTVLSSTPLLIALVGGVASTCLASALPLLDLLRGGMLDGVYRADGVPGNTLGRRTQRTFACAAAVLLVAASVIYAVAPEQALASCALLALASVMTVPPALGGVLQVGRWLAKRRQSLTALPVAVNSLRSSTLRSLALAATGAVALFGSVALGGARSDLMHGIAGFARSYSADASVWVGSPGDNQAVVPIGARAAAGARRRIAALAGVAGVRSFQGGFLALDGRQTWVIARPPGGAQQVLGSQIVAGQGGPTQAERRLAGGGWIAISQQIAQQLRVGIGGTVRLPTPSGPAAVRVAAETTNLAWSPGAVFIGAREYARLWRTRAPTALAVSLRPGADAAAVRSEIAGALGPGSGLAASTASEREASINALAGEGLNQLQEISTVLLIAAMLAMAAALTSAIWQRRSSLAGLRLAGVSPGRLREILLLESALMLGVGCLTGALAGVYGQGIIDAYLAHVTGFPVSGLAVGLRPLEILAAVAAAVMAIAAAPVLAASRVSPRVAFSD